MRIALTSRVLRSNTGAVARLVDRMRDMNKQKVLIGVPEGVSHSDGINMGALAAIHEFGAPSRGIPERPFLQPSMDKNLDKYKALMAREAKGVVLKRSTLHQALAKVGMLAAADVQAYMVSGAFKPLAASTIKAKGSSKPLIDSGQLRQAITYKVE